MLFRQLFDAKSSTYTYLLADETTREAVLIDPVMEQAARDIDLLRELELKLVYTLETHVHADHVTSSGLLRTRLGSQSVISGVAGVGCADRLVDDGEIVRFGGEELEVRTTPGHTDCSVSFVHHGSRRVFTGDALLIRGCGRTDFQQGDPATLYRSIHEKVFSLPEDYTVYPGHDYRGRTASSVGEEKRLNPRLGGDKTEAEFIEIMKNLDLPRPKLIDVAVPANQKCGYEGRSAPSPSWSSVVRTPDGVPEVSAEWVRAHRAEVRVIDVREPTEFTGDLGHVDGAELVPLATVEQAAASWDRDAQIVTVCRSGGRSGKAARALEGLGFTAVASMAGGMMRWDELKLPVSA